MSGRQRGSSARGIRKRKPGGKRLGKNNPKRQRLAKVATRADARNDVLDARAAARKAADTTRQRTSTSRFGNEGSTQGSGGPSAFDSDSDSDLSTPAAASGFAYNTLLESVLPNSDVLSRDLVKKSIHPDTEPSGSRTKDARAVIGAVESGRSRRSSVPSTRGTDADVDFSADAAAREHSYLAANLDTFSSEQLSSSYYETSKGMDVPGVGRISVASSPQSSVRTASDLFSNVELGSMCVNSLGVQPSVLKRWRRMAKHPIEGNRRVLCPDETLSRREAACVLALRSFRDLLMCSPMSPIEESRMRQLAVAHCLSHALRGGARVLRNNSKLRDTGLAEELDDESLRDQGFTRARVLILAPMRNDAYDIVSLICGLAVGTEDGQEGVAQVGNRDRFEDEFGGDSSEAEDVGESARQSENAGTSLQNRPTSHRLKTKPADWTHRFRGNVDDDFKLGISLTKKSIKLYSDFYESDIIVASPLGLVRSMEAKKSGVRGKARVGRDQKSRQHAEEEWNAGRAKPGRGVHQSSNKAASQNRDDDDDSFLSSIEICVVDGAHVFGMQNWSLVLSALGLVNNMPSSPRDTDFARVRQFCLDNLMRHFRQTVIFSNYVKPDILSLFRSLRNHSGRVRILPSPKRDGTISDVVVPARQRFIRVGDVDSPAEAPKQRLAWFMNKIVPEIRSSVDCQALVVVPSYFDFVQLRNKLLALVSEEGSFEVATMSEYSKESDVARAKTKFFTKKVRLLVTTERLHYYWRSRVRGANTIIWYGLPENDHFYPEIVNFTAEAAEQGRPVQSVVLYDELDALALERVVGTLRSKRMTSRSSRSIYLFT